VGGARPARLSDQLPRVRIEVVRREPVRVTVIAAGGASVEIDDPGPMDHRHEFRLGTRVGESGPAELAQQLQVVLPGAAHRPDDRRDVSREHREDPAQAPLDRQEVDDVGTGQAGWWPRLRDVVDLHGQHPAE